MKKQNISSTKKEKKLLIQNSNNILTSPSKYLTNGPYCSDYPISFLRNFSNYKNYQVSDKLIFKIITDIRNYFNPAKYHTSTTQKKSESRCLPVSVILRRRLRTCGSIASVSALVLRYLGLPTKLIDGKLKRNGVWRSHAWIEVYLPGKNKFIPFDAFSAEYKVGRDHRRVASYNDWSQWCKS
ncbi:MAG: transglutaminase-like domain-containing protein [Candidatus Komeilibacteria bacterium]